MEFAPLDDAQCEEIDIILRSAMRSSIFDESAQWLPRKVFHMCPSLMDSHGIRCTKYMQEGKAINQLILDLNSPNDKACKVWSRNVVQHLMATGTKGAPNTYGWGMALSLLNKYELELYNPSTDECPFATAQPLRILREAAHQSLSYNVANKMANHGVYTVNELLHQDPSNIARKETITPWLDPAEYDELCRAWYAPHDKLSAPSRSSRLRIPQNSPENNNAEASLPAFSCATCGDEYDDPCTTSRFYSPQHDRAWCTSCAQTGRRNLNLEYPDLRK